jgi:predicted NACHT family NTPase
VGLVAQCGDSQRRLLQIMVDRLSIRNFAQLAAVDLEFADLTVLVGAQGTGKSLALQWLKTALDQRKILEALEDAGHPTKRPEVVLDLIFGAGCDGASSSRLASPTSAGRC